MWNFLPDCPQRGKKKEKPLKTWSTCKERSVCAKSLQLCLILWDPMDCTPARPLCPRDSPGKNTWEGCHALLQGIFPTQGWNPSLLQLLHSRQILYCWAIREALLRYLLFCCLVWLAYTFIFFCCPWSVMSTSGFSPFYLYKMSLG